MYPFQKNSSTKPTILAQCTYESLPKCSIKNCSIPLAIVEHNKDAFWVIVEHFIMMPICIADDEVKYASVNNIQQQRTSLIEWSASNITTIMLSIVFPPTNKSNAANWLQFRLLYEKKAITITTTSEWFAIAMKGQKLFNTCQVSVRAGAMLNRTISLFYTSRMVVWPFSTNKSVKTEQKSDIY